MTSNLVSQGMDTLETIGRELGKDPHLASLHTRRTYHGALTDFETWRAGRPMTKTLAQAYAVHLREDRGLAPATVNHKLAAVRWWARRLADLAAESDALDADQRREVMTQAARTANVRNVRGSSEQRGRHVTDGELRALLTACAADASPIGARDAAMIALAAATGLRRSEIADLEREDVADLEENGYEVAVRHGKGDKARSVAIYNGARDWLSDWLDLRGDAPGPMFLAVRKGGEIRYGHGIGTQAMYERLLRRTEEAGISKPIAWHDFRRTLAGNLLDGGADLATVQRILGHSSPVTTSAYDRRPEEARRRALRGLHVPYLRR